MPLISYISSIILTSLSFINASPLTERSTPVEHPESSRRGVAYNNPSYVRYFNPPGSQVHWVYNWDSLSGATHTPFEYVAMLHSNRPEHTGKWMAAVERSAMAQPDDPTHLLGFNEPDNCQPGTGGACMSLDDSVAAWWAFMEPAKQLKEKMYLGSPAVTNGGGEMGVVWLRRFLNSCSGCHIDFICTHWYDSATNFAAFKAHIDSVRAIADGRPIWVTEFGASGSDDEVKSFFDLAIPYMDNSKDVHRYAYFFAAPGSLLAANGDTLSDIGRYYVLWGAKTAANEQISASGENKDEGVKKVEKRNKGHPSSSV